jgi:hypothetical protein
MIMTDPPSYDQDLLNRFNALKKSSITLDTNEYVGPFKSPGFIAERRAVQAFPSQGLVQLQKRTWLLGYVPCVME